MKIETKIGNIELNLDELAELLTEDQKLDLAKSLCWGQVMTEAVERLRGGSESWCPQDHEKALELLLDFLNNGASIINPLDEMRKFLDSLKRENFERRLYWTMYHWPVEEEQRFFQNWLEKNGFGESEYCDEESSEWRSKIEKKIWDQVHDFLENKLREKLDH